MGAGDKPVTGVGQIDNHSIAALLRRGFTARRRVAVTPVSRNASHFFAASFRSVKSQADDRITGTLNATYTRE